MLHWYKKRGGAVLKSIDAEAISAMSLLHSSKPVLYSVGTYSTRSACLDRWTLIHV